MTSHAPQILCLVAHSNVQKCELSLTMLNSVLTHGRTVNTAQHRYGGTQAYDQERTILLFRNLEAYRQVLHVLNAKSASRCARHFDGAGM